LPLGPELLIFVSMMREEWRLHKSFQGAIGSHVFPAVIFVFSAFLSLSAPLILGNIDASRILLLIHLGALGYGLFVGAMGYIGEQVMTRRFGQVDMVLGIPRLLPVSFRRVMAVFYVKDAVYYVLYSIIPLVLGAAVGAPLAGVSLLTVGRLGVTAFLAFMTGMGVSFLLSAAHIRSRALLGSLMLLLGCSVASVWPLGVLMVGDLLLPLGYWYGRDSLYLLFSAAVALLLSAAAIFLMRERFEAPQRVSVEMFAPVLGRLSSLGDLGALLAKEWVELLRGGALEPVVAGYIAPLVVIYAMVWLLGEGLGVPIYFNVVFYGGFVGFLGVTVYSWINNLECNEFLNVQPVGVNDVVSAKLILYFALTFSISTCYVVAIGFLNGELGFVLEHGIRGGGDLPADGALDQHDALRREGALQVRGLRRPTTGGRAGGLLHDRERPLRRRSPVDRGIGHHTDRLAPYPKKPEGQVVGSHVLLRQQLLAAGVR
jgi:hypothetical protein